jgi:hypothetical protein
VERIAASRDSGRTTRSQVQRLVGRLWWSEHDIVLENRHNWDLACGTRHIIGVRQWATFRKQPIEAFFPFNKLSGLDAAMRCDNVCDPSKLRGEEHRLPLPIVDEPDRKIMQQLIIFRFLVNGFDRSQAKMEFLAVRFSSDVTS